MSNQLNEISARVTLIEGGMLNSSSVSKDTKPNVYRKVEENRTFSVSNRMPLKNFNDLNALEDNLNKVEFRKIAVINVPSP